MRSLPLLLLQFTSDFSLAIAVNWRIKQPKEDLSVSTSFSVTLPLKQINSCKNWQDTKFCYALILKQVTWNRLISLFFVSLSPLRRKVTIKGQIAFVHLSSSYIYLHFVFFNSYGLHILLVCKTDLFSSAPGILYSILSAEAERLP